MQRTLFIELGETFGPAFERLRSLLAPQIERGEAAFFASPIVGDGNLSKPIERLQRSLEERLESCLVELLTLGSDAGSDLTLDIFVCTNAGERRAIEAVEETMAAVLALLDRDYGAVFPAHRRGLERGLRCFKVVLLPHNRDSERPRTEAVAATARMVSECGGWGSEGRESPIDRVLLLDAETSRGIASIETLLTQAEIFLCVVSDKSFRRSDLIVDTLDRPSPHRCATIGAAHFVLPFGAIADAVADRICDDLRAIFEQRPREELRLPTAEELTSSFAVLRDDALERAIEQLERHIPRAYEKYGFGGIEGAVADIAEAEKRLGAWRAAGLTKRLDDQEAVELAQTPSSADGPGSKRLAAAGSLVLGLAMVALAHLVFGLSLAVSAGVAGFFALAGLALTLLVVSLSTNKRAESSRVDHAMRRDRLMQEPEGLTPEQRLDLLTSAAASARQKGRRLVDALASLNPRVEFGSDHVGAGRPWRWEPELRGLGQLAYEAVRDYSDERELEERLQKDLPSLADLLDARASIDDAQLVAFARTGAAGAANPALLDDHAVRDYLVTEAQAFLKRWEHGIPPFIELARDRHLDTNGYEPVRNAFFTDSRLRAAVEALSTELAGPFAHVESTPGFPMVALLSVRCGIPAAAIATFSEHIDDTSL